MRGHEVQARGPGYFHYEQFVKVYVRAEAVTRDLDIMYMRRIECPRNCKNFRTSDNQMFKKFWLSPFATTMILNPKVDTVPRKFEK